MALPVLRCYVALARAVVKRAHVRGATLLAAQRRAADVLTTSRVKVA